MNPKLYRILIAILGVVFVGSALMLAQNFLEYREGEEIYAEAQTLIDLPTLPASIDTAPSTPSDEPDAPVYVDPYADALSNMDFTGLREVNNDILGWILIPNTRLSYPLLQGADNHYYLDHTWKKSQSIVGAVFMDYRNNSSLGDFHTIIYGHRMNDGSMFASLKNYNSQSHWFSHPYLYISDDNGSHAYEIFAAYEVSTSSATYQQSFADDASKQAFLDFCIGESVIDTGVTPTVYDKIVTLSTCTTTGHATRWVVQARIKGVAPEPAEPEVLDITNPESPEPIVSETPVTTTLTPPAEAPPIETTPMEITPGETTPVETNADNEEHSSPTLEAHAEGDDGKPIIDDIH